MLRLRNVSPTDPCSCVGKAFRNNKSVEDVEMADILNLALPFFGLISLGFAAGKFSSLSDDGLAWMNFFLIYVALPCLFYRVLARTPADELGNIPFIAGIALATATMFAVAFCIGMVIRHGDVAQSAIIGAAGAYGNVGYMGPGLALATLGPAAAPAVALIFCIDSVLAFALVPLLMGVAGTRERSIASTIVQIIRQIVFHPFLIAAALGVLSAVFHVELPIALDRMMELLQGAAAPCALFTLGVTVALRPIMTIPWEVPPVLAVKLIVHPISVLVVLSLIGSFSPVWVGTAVLMAALPPALNVYVMARQYEAWLEQASAAVLFGTMASVVTLTTVMWLVQTATLPMQLFR
jgi:malonate transporter and related proteins